MREKTILPTNFLDWPRVAPLLPELKLILGLGLWGGRYTSGIGVATVPYKPLAASLGLDPSALRSGIETLHATKLVLADFDSDEVFIVDWFRFHQFKKGVGQEIARREFGKIESSKIAEAVRKSAPWLISNLPQNEESEGKQTHDFPSPSPSPSLKAAVAAIPTDFAQQHTHGLRGGPAQLDRIFHFLSGSLAVNAYAALGSAGRFSK